MITIKELEDLIKENHELGNYQAAATQYKQWRQDYKNAKKNQQQTKISDFQLGYGQAEFDYNHHQAFKEYPSNMVELSNKVSNANNSEVSDFIRGYKQAQKELTN